MATDPANGTSTPAPRPATLAVHAGRERVPGAPLAAAPVFASVYAAGGEAAYAREGNPTWAGFERALAALEGGGDAVAFSSGMAAAAAVLATLEPGARVVVGHSTHVEVRNLLAERAAAGALDVLLCDAGDADAFGAAMRGAALAWIDSITNPTLEVAPLAAIAARARAGGTTLLVDATLATPILQRPLELGAGVVLHSAGKYLGGHSDLLLGAVTTRMPRLAAELRGRREALGATPGSMEAWLALRGMRTLELRVRRGSDSAAVLAGRLATHPQVEEVWYPGPATTMPAGLHGQGAMLSFTVVGGPAHADAVCRAVRLIVHAGSLGGVETLIERHARWHDEPAVPPALLRLSVGCEHVDDLWDDLDRALAATTQRREAGDFAGQPGRRARARSLTASKSPDPANRTAVMSSQRPR